MSVAGTGNSTHVWCHAPRVSAGQQVTLVIQDGGTTLITRQYTYHPSLFVSDYSGHRIVRFNADTGAYVDDFVPTSSGGLDRPWGMAFGIDHNFYVASEGTSSIIQYDGSSGKFLRRFCSVPGEPRGIVFHYQDLFVASAHGNAVLRYNGQTGSPRGTFVHDILSPWGIAFDRYSNDTYVSSERKDHVYRYKQPLQGLWGELGIVQSANERQQDRTFARFDRVFTNSIVPACMGLVFTVDSLYVVSPEVSKIARFNRTSGELMHMFDQPEAAWHSSDIKEYRDYVYVLNEHQVHKYHRLNGEFIRVHAELAGLVGGVLLFHHNDNLAMGD